MSYVEPHIQIPQRLEKKLGALHLWGLAVGLVISGEYFGWSYGWAKAGTVGFLIATLLSALLYLTFVFSFTELTTAIPDAGGPYAYAKRAMGNWAGFFAGLSTTIEFLFAPPAIAFALAGYLHVIVPGVSITAAAIIVMILFGVINLFEVHQSARFEMFVTLLAVGELLLFIAVCLPHFQMANFMTEPFRGGVYGILESLPYAIWFFLAIEGVAMTAEEVKNPKRDIPLGYITGILTLIFLALGVMLSAGGVGDWNALSQMDYPIPKAVEMALGSANPIVKIFAGVGLFGLVASLNGIVLGASRQIYAVSRAGLLPTQLSKLNSKGVPHYSVLVCVVFGIGAILSGKTAQLITLSAFGAIFMYMTAMVSLFILRKKEPHLHRPFVSPFYPWFPAIALILSAISFVAMAYFNQQIFLIFLALMLGSAFFYRIRLGITSRS